MSSNIEATLRDLATKSGGVLTAESVLEEAKNEASPLHAWSGFTWDRDEAALKRNLDEARALIRSVKVDVVTKTFNVEAPFFVKDPSTRSGYASLPRIRSDEELKRDVLLAEFERASAALKRAKHIALALGDSQWLSDHIEELCGGIATAAKPLQDQQAAGAA